MISVSDDQFKRFQSLIYEHSGIRLDDRKQTLLQSRLQRRLRKINTTDVDAYLKIVTRPGGGSELQELIDVITTNETSFFRTQNHFDWFSDKFLPELVTNQRLGRREKQLRIWSAACSNGAEAYSLLFCLHDKRGALADWTTTILASDLSITMLAQAKGGRYAKKFVSSFEGPQLKRYFRECDSSGSEFEVREELRTRIEFFQHNLMKPLKRPLVDCIFLRNVLIYFDDDAKQTVVANMAAQLAPGGYLVIGPSEGIYGLKNPLTKIQTFLYQKPL